MEKICERLKKAMSIKNVKQIELSEKTGIPKSSINQYISGYAEPKQDRISLISNALNVNPSWLMGYDVPMEFESIDSLENSFDLSTTTLTYFDNICVNCSSPILPEYSDVEVKEISLPNVILGDIAGKSNLVAIKSRGDSMDKIIPDGSLVIIQKLSPFESVQNGDIVMYSFEDCWSIKEFIKKDDCVIFRPHSTNPRHKDNIYKFSDMEDGMDIPKIIGKVVYYGVSL